MSHTYYGRLDYAFHGDDLMMYIQEQKDLADLVTSITAEFNMSKGQGNYQVLIDVELSRPPTPEEKAALDKAVLGYRPPVPVVLSEEYTEPKQLEKEVEDLGKRVEKLEKMAEPDSGT